MNRAAEEGVSIKTISNRYAKVYVEDMARLVHLRPQSSRRQPNTSPR
nr:hypothetical protein [Kordiimonas gwangyangensis]